MSKSLEFTKFQNHESANLGKANGGLIPCGFGAFVVDFLFVENVGKDVQGVAHSIIGCFICPDEIFLDNDKGQPNAFFDASFFILTNFRGLLFE